MRSAYSGLKWLIPGMRVKRWVGLIVIGAVVANCGSVFAFGTNVVGWWAQVLTFLNLPDRAIRWVSPVGYVLIGAGILVMLISAYLLVQGIVREIDPEKALRLADVVNQNRIERLARGHDIAVIGGGTGLATMLRGLKARTGNITAIVAVSDDGGSSGRLLREFGVLPPGDIRNCLVALADEEPLMTAIFNYRFQSDPNQPGRGKTGALAGHSLGNLFLTALTDINNGCFDRAVSDASRVLAIRGRVLPSVVEHVSLVADMKDGSTIQGETAIVASRIGITQIRLDPPNPSTFPDAVQAILDASVVVIGPGSVYTSIIPNLLVPEIREALEQTQAIRVYVCNVMTQPGETDGYTAYDHVEAIITQTGFRGIDYVLVNTQQPRTEQLDRYQREGADWVVPDLERIRQLGLEPINGNFVSESNMVRHDPKALAEEIFYLIETAGYTRRRSKPSTASRSRSIDRKTADI